LVNMKKIQGNAWMRKCISIVSVMILIAFFPMVSAESSTSASRIIENSNISAGGSTNVTITILNNNNISQALSLMEILPSGWTITTVSDDASAFKSTTNEWVWFNVGPGDTETVTYGITMPANASNGTYYINGTISNAGGVIAEVSGENTIFGENTISYDILSITGVIITPTNPSAGTEINITVAINNPGASFNGRVEGNVWTPSGTGKYLGWENVPIPSGASTVTILGPAGGAESSYNTHQAGTYLYDVYLENVDKGQVYTNPTDSKTGVPFTVGAAASVYISDVTLSASPTVGSVMTLKVIISNPTAFTGTMDANIWDSSRGYVLAPQSISITAGGTTTLTFSYTPVNHGLHSYDFFMVSAVPGQNTKTPWGFPCMDYVAGIGFTVV